jgi:hypothetical protein
MAVELKTAKELVRRIIDLQRAMRCIAVSGSQGTETGLGLQGVLLLIGEGEFRASHLAARMGVGAPALSRYIGELDSG